MRHRLAAIVSDIDELLAARTTLKVSGKPAISQPTYHPIQSQQSINGSSNASYNTAAHLSENIVSRAMPEIPVVPSRTTIDTMTVINAAGPLFKHEITTNPSHNWEHLFYIAKRQAIFFGITPALWEHATAIMGPRNATMSIVVMERCIDDKRPGTHAPIRIPAAYFKALITRARAGTLNLERSIRWLNYNTINDSSSKIPIKSVR
jgi:hypothetical protein